MKKNAIRLLVCAAAVVIALCSLSWIFTRKYSFKEYTVFYEKADEFDVLFFGPSVAHYEIYPMELWNEYGITSYNMANDAERVTMTYYSMKNALDYANPKLVVVDLNGLVWRGQTRDDSSVDHAFLDSLPVSKNKYEEVINVFGEDEVAEYMMPTYLYHTRYTDLGEDDFALSSRTALYGAEFHAGTAPELHPNQKKYKPDEVEDALKGEFKNLQKIIDLCEEKDVELLFIYIPIAKRDGYRQMRYATEEYLTAQGANYIDMLDDECVFWAADFIDSVHMNYYGGKRLTKRLGEIVTTQYGIEDHRDADFANSWNEDYAVYETLVQQHIAEYQESYDYIWENTPEQYR